MATTKDDQQMEEKRCPAKYQLLPDLLPEEYDLLRASIADHGVEVPIIVDQEGNIIDGLHRQRACDELGVNCPREVRHFETEPEKVELALRLNCRRRQLDRKQKRNLIAAYLKCDPQIADNYLGEIIGGISKNTVADVRAELEATCLIDKFETLRGKDGKGRPTKYKKIIANTPKEAETAQKIVGDLPDNCAGKVIDTNTAQRRARRNRRRKEIEGKVIEPLGIDDIKIFHSKFQDLEAIAGIQPETTNLMVADVPYNMDFLPQTSDLAELAFRILVDGGLLALYCGQYWLPETIRRLDAHLTYRWTRASVWDGDGNLIHPLDVTSQWKPILLYSKGPWVKRGRWPDVSRINSKEKDWHPWQQPLAEVENIVRYFSGPGDLVVDPVGGGFTTAVACYRLGRRCISCDCEESYVEDGRRRLAEEMAKPLDEPESAPLFELNEEAVSLPTPDPFAH